MALRILRIATLGVLACNCCRSEPSAEIRRYDLPYIDRAIAAYSNGKLTRDQVLSEVDPEVVYLPEMVCVGMKLKTGYAGGDTTICFSKTDGKRVVYHVEGD